MGSTESGKTWLIREVLYHHRHKFERAIVMSGSKETSQMFAHHIPSLYIYDGFEPEKLKQAFEQQEIDVQLHRSKPLLIILDDLMYDKKNILGTPLISRIFMNGRHSNCLLLISMQYAKDIGPNLRQQVKTVFLCHENNIQSRLKSYEAFNLIFNSFAEWEAVIKQCTQNYEVMVLLKTMSDKISDNVFWFKAKERRKFRVGKRGIWWKIHGQLYDPRYFLKPICAPIVGSTKKNSTSSKPCSRFNITKVAVPKSKFSAVKI